MHPNTTKTTAHAASQGAQQPQISQHPKTFGPFSTFRASAAALAKPTAGENLVIPTIAGTQLRPTTIRVPRVARSVYTKLHAVAAPPVAVPALTLAALAQPVAALAIPTAAQPVAAVAAAAAAQSVATETATSLTAAAESATAEPASSVASASSAAAASVASAASAAPALRLHRQHGTELPLLGRGRRRLMHPGRLLGQPCRRIQSFGDLR